MSAQSSGAFAAPWSNICQHYPNQWVCVVDINHEADGSIRSARVIAHDASIARALDQLGTSNPDATVVHTCGHPLVTSVRRLSAG